MQFKTLAVSIHVNIPVLWAQGVKQRDTQTSERKQVFSNGGQINTALIKQSLEGFHFKAAPNLGAVSVYTPLTVSPKSFQTSYLLPIGFQLSKPWRKMRVVVRTWEGMLPEFIWWRILAGAITVGPWLCPSEGDACSTCLSKGFASGDTLTSKAGMQTRHCLIIPAKHHFP